MEHKTSEVKPFITSHHITETGQSETKCVYTEFLNTRAQTKRIKESRLRFQQISEQKPTFASAVGSMITFLNAVLEINQRHKQ